MMGFRRHSDCTVFRRRLRRTASPQIDRFAPAINTRAGLAAEPLRWPVSERDSVMLCAVALAVWKSGGHPVVLHADSILRLRGQTERAHTDRFGFSAQKIRTVFGGKFEVDIQPASLGPAGETWQVDLPLANVRPLHPPVGHLRHP